MMHTIFQSLFSVFVTCMLTACGNDVSLVKTGYLPFDRTLTIGKALDKYQYFSQTAWTYFIDEEQRHVVEFQGMMNLDMVNKYFYNKRVDMMSYDIPHDRHSTLPSKVTIALLNNIEKICIIIQFNMHIDKTFNIGHTFMESTNNKHEKRALEIDSDSLFHEIYTDRFIREHALHTLIDFEHLQDAPSLGKTPHS